MRYNNFAVFAAALLLAPVLATPVSNPRYSDDPISVLPGPNERRSSGGIQDERDVQAGGPQKRDPTDFPPEVPKARASQPASNPPRKRDPADFPTEQPAAPSPAPETPYKRDHSGHHEEPPTAQEA